MNLFEIKEQAKQVLAMDEMDEQTVNDTLEGLGLHEKLASYSAVIKTINSNADAIAVEIKRLQNKKRIEENKALRLKEFALSTMQELGISRGGDALHSLTIRQGGKKSRLVIEDDAQFPREFINLIEKQDIVGLKKALKNGDDYEGIHLEDGEQSIVIK